MDPLNWLRSHVPAPRTSPENQPETEAVVRQGLRQAADTIEFHDSGRPIDCGCWPHYTTCRCTDHAPQDR